MSAAAAVTRLYLGGTFNPIHIGHARLALECAQQLAASHLALVPCYLPPHKPEPFVELTHRLAMVEQVAAELRQAQNGCEVTVEPFELKRREASYTLNTLQYLRERHPQDKLAWLIGMDSLNSLNHWHQWQQLTELANLIVVNRPGCAAPTEGPVAQWLQPRRRALSELGERGAVAFCNTTPLWVSSTAIREQIAGGCSPRYLLPESVFTYIQDNNLYSN